MQTIWDDIEKNLQSGSQSRNALQFLNRSQVLRLVKSLQSDSEEQSAGRSAIVSREIFSNCEQLSFFGCALSDDDARKMSVFVPSFQQVRKLDFSNNKLKTAASLRRLFPNLNVLKCSQNLISELNLRTTCKITKLDLSFNQLSDLGNSLDLLPHLKILNLSNNRLTEIHFKINKDLETLNLSINRLRSVQGWQNLSSVKSVNLYGNRLSSLREQNKMIFSPTLESLNLKNNQLSHVPFLVCGRLKELHIQQNPLIGFNQNKLILPNLQKLDLDLRLFENAYKVPKVSAKDILSNFISSIKIDSRRISGIKILPSKSIFSKNISALIMNIVSKSSKMNRHDKFETSFNHLLRALFLKKINYTFCQTNCTSCYDSIYNERDFILTKRRNRYSKIELQILAFVSQWTISFKTFQKYKKNILKYIHRQRKMKFYEMNVSSIVKIQSFFRRCITVNRFNKLKVFLDCKAKSRAIEIEEDPIPEFDGLLSSNIYEDFSFDSSVNTCKTIPQKAMMTNSNDEDCKSELSSTGNELEGKKIPVGELKRITEGKKHKEAFKENRNTSNQTFYKRKNHFYNTQLKQINKAKKVFC